jgi:uncharacterized membrane protein YgdD (TMEM256/DUF423 family)
MANRWIALGSLGGLASVALGAATTHLVKGNPQAQPLLETASRYLMTHSLALVAVGILARQGTTLLLRASGTGFALGAAIFSGGLTGFALTGNRIAQYATPVGGSLLMLGWLMLAFFGMSHGRR